MPPDERARDGRVPRLPVPGRNPRREQHVFPARRAERRRAAHRGEPELDAGQFLRAVRAKLKLLEIERRSAAARGQCRLLRRREKAQRDLPDGDAGAAARDPRRDRQRPRHRRAAPGRATASTSCARPTARSCMITHYQRLLDYVEPDRVHVLQRRPHRRIRRQEPRRRAREARLRRPRRRRVSRDAVNPCDSRSHPRKRTRALSRPAISAPPAASSSRALGILADAGTHDERRRRFPGQARGAAYLDAFARDASEPMARCSATCARPLRRTGLSDPARRSLALPRSAALEQRRCCRRRMRPPTVRDARRVGCASASRLVLVDGRISRRIVRDRRAAGGRLARLDGSGARRAAGAGRRRARSRCRRTPSSPSPRSTPRSSPTASCSTSRRASCSSGRSRSSISRPARAPRRCTSAASIMLGAGSRATLVETYAGDGRYWTNAVADGAARRRRGADPCRAAATKARDALHLRPGRARRSAPRRGSTSFALTARRRPVAPRDGRAHRRRGRRLRLRRRLSAARRAGGEHRHRSSTTRRPRGTTREFFKGVVDDRAHGAFHGRITVRAGAQKTDAQQTQPQTAAQPPRRRSTPSPSWKSSPTT